MSRPRHQHRRQLAGAPGSSGVVQRRIVLPMRHALSRAYELHQAGDLRAALQLYADVLKADPRHPIALHYAALLTRQLNDEARSLGQPTRDEEAMRLMALSVAAAPKNAAAVHNCAKFADDRGDYESARELYEHAVRLNPTQGESWTNLGNVYGRLGERMQAEAAWARAMECPAETADARFNLAFLELLKGDLAGGFRDYESRFECPEFIYRHGRPDLTSPRWNGEPIRGTLYVHGEQGAGDAIMMARYLPWCAERAETVVVEVIRGMVPLFRAMLAGLPMVRVQATADDPVPEHTAHVSLMSLPYLAGTTVETVPSPLDSASFAADLASIAPEPDRIGLCWRGSTTHVNDRTRSMPFEATFPLLDLAASHGFRFQSLQFGYEVSPPLEPMPAGDFLETARQIARCGLVVTVDTSIAHLAGTLGVPTLILLPFVAEWRWMLDREDTPWYPSARLVRQRQADDWADVIDRVCGIVTSCIEPAEGVA